MYIPEHFRVRHDEASINFIRANPFAILVSQTSEGPFATHLPVIIDQKGGHENEGQVILRGHVARENPHWRHLESQPQALVIFHGPHAYISPSLYTLHESVPTWNYAAVHAYGEARIFSEPEQLLPLLHDLIGIFEARYAEQWAELREEYRDRMLRHIVGFEITVTRLEGKFKLSQNRMKQEQENVIASLGTSNDTAISGTAQMMREQGLGVKKENG